MGHVIFSLHLGVGHSVLLQLEGVGHVFSNHHILKCSGPSRPPPPPVLFEQSLNDLPAVTKYCKFHLYAEDTLLLFESSSVQAVEAALSL